MSRGSPAGAPLWASLAVAAAAVLWGSALPVGKVALQSVTPYHLAMVRGLAPGIGIGLGLAASGRGGALLEEFRSRPWRILGLGTLCFFAFINLTSASLERLPASINSLLVNTSPLLLALGFAVAHRRLPSSQTGLGLTLGFGGVAALALRGTTGGAPIAPLGVVLAVGASAVWALYTEWGRRELQRGDPIVVTAASSLAALVPFGVVGVLTGDLETFPSATIRAPLALGFNALFGGVIAYALWNVGLRRLSATSAAAFQYAIPLTAVILSIAFLGEPLSPSLILGGVAILAGVGLAQHGRTESTPPIVEPD